MRGRAMANALQAVLDKAAGREIESPKPEPKPPFSGTVTEEKFFRPARVGKRFVGAHFDPQVARQLKMLAAEDDKTIQELLEDAVDLLFVKAGKARIADLTRKS
jgi:hypothetical protein